MNLIKYSGLLACVENISCFHTYAGSGCVTKGVHLGAENSPRIKNTLYRLTYIWRYVRPLQKNKYRQDRSLFVLIYWCVKLTRNTNSIFCISSSTFDEILSYVTRLLDLGYRSTKPPRLTVSYNHRPYIKSTTMRQVYPQTAQ